MRVPAATARLSAISHLGWFGDTAFLARLAVKPSWQGQGFGRALLVQGVELAQQAGMRRMLLGTQQATCGPCSFTAARGFERPANRSTPLCAILKRR
jgi:predicted N-acetyltransferase YhbS